jgi:hypothetical protein
MDGPHVKLDLKFFTLHDRIIRDKLFLSPHSKCLLFQMLCLRHTNLKGVSSKPSGTPIVAPNLCFLSKRPQILATCLFLFC